MYKYFYLFVMLFLISLSSSRRLIHYLKCYLIGAFDGIIINVLRHLLNFLFILAVLVLRDLTRGELLKEEPLNPF